MMLYGCVVGEKISLALPRDATEPIVLECISRKEGKHHVIGAVYY